jgi:hypothetical protein
MNRCALATTKNGRRTCRPSVLRMNGSSSRLWLGVIRMPCPAAIEPRSLSAPTVSTFVIPYRRRRYRGMYRFIARGHIVPRYGGTGT